MDATVVGFDDSPLRFEQLVITINEGERLLGIPYPAPKVTMKRVQNVSSGFCGHNQMTYALRYSGAPYVVESSTIEIRIDEDCTRTFDSIAHEAAHTWFHGNDPADWIDEGLANAIEQQVVSTYLQGETIYPPITYCKSYRNIGELEQGKPSRIVEDHYTGFGCNYSLGDGIFGVLRDHYGDSEFNRKIAHLARKATSGTNREHSISDIRRLLGDDRTALEIINLWYDGQPEMRKYRHLDSVEWTFAPVIDGDYLYFAGKIGNNETVHDFVLGENPFCSQFVLYEGIGDQDWLTSVSDPLRAGWSHNEDSRVITINHQISPDTGEFSVTAKVLGNVLANVGDLSLMVRSRVTTGADGLCKESIGYSQVPVSVGRIPGEFKAAKFYHLDAIQWTFPPTIDGDYLYFAGKTTEPGMVHKFVLGDDPYCSQFSLYRNIINQERVASIDNPLHVGQSYREVPKLVVVNDRINATTGEFSITARINDPSLAGIQDLSLVVSRRVTTGANNLCGETVTYSQVSVSTGKIPNQLKTGRHYHMNAVEWTGHPALHGNTLKLAGKAEPGIINLEYQKGYCSQFNFYTRDERGYHYIDSLNPFLSGNRQWTGQITGKVTRYRIGGDGTFEATATLRDEALSGYANVILVVKELVPVDSATNKCGKSDVLSAIDIER